MGSKQTGQMLLSFIAVFHSHVEGPTLELANHLLRKSGHFLGYGTLGVIFCRAWAAQLNRFTTLTWTDVRLRGAILGVLSVFLVACADEYHQSFLPGRTSTFTDVLLDTCGALIVNTIVFLVLAARRRSLRQDLSALRALRFRATLAYPKGLAA